MIEGNAGGSDDTICALATPPGRAGLGVIRVSGPRAFAILDAVTWRPNHTPCGKFAGHTLHRADVVQPGGEVIDDVLLAVFHGPRSYTGEDVVEISAHGGTVPLGQILARLLQAGARAANPGEFTQRAYLNGKMDLAQAEAVGDLIAARTEEAYRLARRQSEGRLSRAVGEVRDGVLGVLARIEAVIDFPEDVGELDGGAAGRELAASDRQIAALLATAGRGILYREGLQVVLAGRPNVGKSSLLNALLHTDRAIVTPTPGTTRDVIEETFSLRGLPLRLVDTAGLRETDDAVEQAGVARTRASLDAADITLLVLDASAGETAEDTTLRESLADRPYLLVWNKWDLKPGTAPPAEGIVVSAATGWNLAALEDALAVLALGDRGAEPEGTFVTHARHRQALESAQTRLDQARATLAAGLPVDFVSIDLRGALDALGEITGETAAEDVIAEIFSRFCIGK
jgi:tRNA modification GTPase